MPMGKLKPYSCTKAAKAAAPITAWCSNTVCKPITETHMTCVTEMVNRPVCEIVMKDCSYTVAKTVCETHYRDVPTCITKQICVLETRTECYQASRPVCETVYCDVQVQVCKPVCETVMRDVVKDRKSVRVGKEC